MASVRIQDILDHLSGDIKKALKAAIDNSTTQISMKTKCSESLARR